MTGGERRHKKRFTSMVSPHNKGSERTLVSILCAFHCVIYWCHEQKHTVKHQEHSCRKEYLSDDEEVEEEREHLGAQLQPNKVADFAQRGAWHVLFRTLVLAGSHLLCCCPKQHTADVFAAFSHKAVSARACWLWYIPSRQKAVQPVQSNTIRKASTTKAQKMKRAKAGQTRSAAGKNEATTCFTSPQQHNFLTLQHTIPLPSSAIFCNTPTTLLNNGSTHPSPFSCPLAIPNSSPRLPLRQAR